MLQSHSFINTKIERSDHSCQLQADITRDGCGRWYKGRGYWILMWSGGGGGTTVLPSVNITSQGTLALLSTVTKYDGDDDRGVWKFPVSKFPVSPLCWLLLRYWVTTVTISVMMEMWESWPARQLGLTVNLSASGVIGYLEGEHATHWTDHSSYLISAHSNTALLGLVPLYST